MSPKSPSQATLLVELAIDLELFSTPRQEAYVAIENGGHREIWPLRTKPFKTWLARLLRAVREGARLAGVAGRARRAGGEGPVRRADT
jgi:hypothetical protein